MIDYSAPQPMVPVPFLRIAATIPDFNGLSGKTLATFDTMVKIAAGGMLLLITLFGRLLVTRGRPRLGTRGQSPKQKRAATGTRWTT